jgi:hypothetical protein
MERPFRNRLLHCEFRRNLVEWHLLESKVFGSESQPRNILRADDAAFETLYNVMGVLVYSCMIHSPNSSHINALLILDLLDLRSGL